MILYRILAPSWVTRFIIEFLDEFFLIAETRHRSYANRCLHDYRFLLVVRLLRLHEPRVDLPSPGCIVQRPG